MTRSYKLAMVWISKARTAIHRRRERRRMRQELNTTVIHHEEKEPSAILDADFKELGKDEWGTRCGLEFDNIDALENDRHSSDYAEEKKKLGRK